MATLEDLMSKKHPECKAHKVNHPLDPVEWDCPYSECEEGCKYKHIPMEEVIISFETAKVAHEKGFSSEGWAYRKSGTLSDGKGFLSKLDIYSAPTQSLLQKWLREEHKIHIVSALSFNAKYCFLVHEGLNPQRSHITDDYVMYEDALEEALLESLKLIK